MVRNLSTGFLDNSQRHHKWLKIKNCLFFQRLFPCPFSCLGVSEGPALLICFLLTNPAKYPMMFKRDNTRLSSAGSHCLYLMQRKFCKSYMRKLHEIIWKSLAMFAVKGNQWSKNKAPVSRCFLLVWAEQAVPPPRRSWAAALSREPGAAPCASRSVCLPVPLPPSQTASALPSSPLFSLL